MPGILQTNSSFGDIATGESIQASRMAAENALRNEAVKAQNQASVGQVIGQVAGAGLKTGLQYAHMANGKPTSANPITKQNAPVMKAFLHNLFGLKSALPEAQPEDGDD